MPDIRTLLHEAAPEPSRPLDMAAVRAISHRRSLRRVVAWIAAAGAVVTGAQVGTGQLVPGGRTAVLEFVDPAPDASEPTTGSTFLGPVSTAPATAVPAGPQTPAEPSSEVPAVGSATTATTQRPRPDTLAPLYPPAPSCSVETVGLAAGEQRSCSFTATEAGGWNYYLPDESVASVTDPIVRVSVTRGHAVAYYEPGYTTDGFGVRHVQACTDAIIEPGDRVYVLVEQAASWMEIRSETGVGAGAGWGCSEPGP